MKMVRWELECTNSQILLEGKEVVLMLSLFKLFAMLWEEELFGKVMYLWGELLLSDIEWVLVWGWWLLLILKALDLLKSLKDLG